MADEVGDRDGWVCGICKDSARLVDPSPNAPRALTPSVDHIVAVSSGGPHARSNVQITHLWCNVERNSGKPKSPEYLRAQLSRLLDGTPVPEELYRDARPPWQWPASPRVEYSIALSISAGRVTADPRYGDPATRLADAARLCFGAAADDAIRSGLEWAAKTRRRRAEIDARWRAARWG
jgi:hypothetical protein